jgi:hypothetical protein
MTDKVPDSLWWLYRATTDKKDAKRKKEMRNHVVVIRYQDTSAGTSNRIK